MLFDFGRAIILSIDAVQRFAQDLVKFFLASQVFEHSLGKDLFTGRDASRDGNIERRRITIDILALVFLLTELGQCPRASSANRQ